MDDPSLLPFLNNNGNGHHFAVELDDEIEHEEDELDDDDDDGYEQNAPYPEDEIDDDEVEEDEIDDDDEHQDEQEVLVAPPAPLPPQPQTIQSERGGRRKGVPRRLQLSPQVVKPAAPQQRLLPASLPKPSTGVHHHEQPILTSDQEDNDDEFNNENQFDDGDDDNNNKLSNGLSFDVLADDGKELYDENNNEHSFTDEENVLEIVDDLLADIVTTIVRDIRQSKLKHHPQAPLTNGKMNGHSSHKTHTNGWPKSTGKPEQRMTNGKNSNNGFSQTNSTKASKPQSQQSLPSTTPSMKLPDPSMLFNEFTKMMHLNSQQQLVKHKPSSSSSTFSPPPAAKRQKTSEAFPTSQPTAPLSLQQQQQHQQLLWQMTQQLMMSAQPTELDTSSLLKQQLLGLTPPAAVPKRVGRPPKQQAQPQVMRSSTNMVPPASHASANTSPYERGSFAPRRRGRPPKYVTERAPVPDLPTHELGSSPYDQLFAAIENSVAGNAARTSSAAFQSALASMLGHQAGLSLPPPLVPPPVVRNGGPASMVKQSAGQTRHSLPNPSTALKLSHGDAGNGLDMPVMATKKRGPGRPPKSQTLVDSHQALQATKRMNSSSSNIGLSNNFAPTMVPSSPTSFKMSATFAELLQQQQQHLR